MYAYTHAMFFFTFFSCRPRARKGKENEKHVGRCSHVMLDHVETGCANKSQSFVISVRLVEPSTTLFFFKVFC